MRTFWWAFSTILLVLLAQTPSECALANQETTPQANQDSSPKTSRQTQGLNPLLEEARALVSRRENAKAERLYLKVLETEPNNSEAHAGLGWTLYDTGKPNQGMAEELRSLALDYNNALAHHYIATMYIAKGQNQKAADEYRLEYKIDPKRRCHCGPIERLLKQYPPRKVTKIQ